MSSQLTTQNKTGEELIELRPDIEKLIAMRLLSLNVCVQQHPSGLQQGSFEEMM